MPNMETDQNTIQKWKNWMNEIVYDISVLVETKYVFNEIVSIRKKNKKLQKDNLFWDFLKNNYVAAMVLGICRQVDRDEESSSFINLLNNISEKPKIISKKWFIEQYGNSYQGKMKADMKLVGKKYFKNKFDRENFVDSDIHKLLNHTQEIKKFRDKRIAHKDGNGELKFDINFNDLHKTVDILEQTVLKYNHFRTQRLLSF